MKALEKEIETKNDEIKVVLKRLENAMNSISVYSLPPPSMLTTQSTQSTLIMDSRSTIKFCSNSDIPQLDGAPNYESKCENCGKTFLTEDMLKNHMDEHGWGCDDCYLCFTSKYCADLHELEYHHDTPDGIRYIQDHIPDTTKRLFEAGHRQR